MQSRTVWLAAFALAFSFAESLAQTPEPGGTLRPFRSDRELTAYVREVGAAYRRQLGELQRATPTPQSPVPCSFSPVARRATTGSGSAVVRGVITSGSGAAVENAQVALSELGLTATSAADGTYRIDVPADRLTPSPEVTLRARHIGFMPAIFAMTLQPGDSITVELRLCVAMTALAEVTVTGAAVAQVKDEAVTNNQHAGVDEGDIVKLRGDHLIILRRGRLFTVAVNDGQLKPISMVDAFGPDIDPRNDWYDEIVTFEDKVVVIGYSYERGGTEIGVFRMDDRGRLRYLSTYHLRSDDYYSARNYASRLIGSTLVFYSPLYLPTTDDNPLESLPSMRRWSPAAGGGAFRRISAARRVYRAPRALDPGPGLTMHTVTRCALATPELTCEASVVLGPPGRVFYVSPSAVYVWLSQWGRHDAATSGSIVYRMPLDGSPPTALGVSGSPVDQFSFLEGDDGFLNVVVRSEAAGDAMWAVERASGSLALLRVPLREFGDGTRTTSREAYRLLPTPTGAYSSFQNRFVGTHLLYGSGNGWRTPHGFASSVFVVPLGEERVTEIPLPHGVDRIEVMGRDAVVIGSDTTDLRFTGVRLDRHPHVAQRYTLREASQGELRSHGFFYKPDGSGGGVLGLPVGRPARPGYAHLFTESAGVTFIRNDGRDFHGLGELDALDASASDDRCRASCVDWYGNSRPLFFGGRVLALLGYELVEGVIDGGRITERRRVNFARGRLWPVLR